MTQNEKQIVYKDLCGRLPYGFFVNRHTRFGNEDVFFEGNEYSLGELGYLLEALDKYSEIKVYLRSMHTITDKELNSLCEYCGCNMLTTDKDNLVLLDNAPLKNNILAIDWLNQHHLDYRGLIAKGLAMEAKTNMYRS